MTVPVAQRDIHNVARKFENAIRNLKAHNGVCPENKETILRFVEHCAADDLSVARRLFYLGHLTTIASILGGKPFPDTTRSDVERILVKVGERRNRFHEPIGVWARLAYRITCKVFWRWMRGLDDLDPPETAWIKIRGSKENKLMPEDLLTKEEALRILQVATHPMHKAYATVEYEAGSRPIEVLTLRLKDVEFDKYGAVIRVLGKTGSRRMRLVLSAPALRNWLDIHPNRADPNAPLWVCLEKNRLGEPLGYDRARLIIKQLAKKAGVKKRLNLYSFRHSAITVWATELTEAELCEVFGWRQGSRMPRIYVHLSGRDTDKKILRHHGLIQEEQLEKKTLERRVCPRCKTENHPEGHFCTVCAAPLDVKTTWELERHRQTADEVMSQLIQDPEVKAIITRKLGELGFLDKLNGPAPVQQVRKEPASKQEGDLVSPSSPPTTPARLNGRLKKRRITSLATGDSP